MTDLKTVLKPVSEKHSVKEAVITLFLANPIIKPERFEVLIKDKFKDKFQKFEKVNQVQFQFKGNEGGAFETTPPSILENVGFKFQRFEDGKTVTALQGLNEPLRNFISYHSLDYLDWDLFFPDFKNVLTEVANFHSEIFVNAFSLHYIDEFVWDSDEEIEPTHVFNEKSSLLPNEFFSCQLNNYQLTTVKNDKFKYFDRLEIQVEDRPKKFITISHNVIHNLNDNFALKNLLESPDLQDMLNHAHLLNKKTLVSILTKEVCDIIKIKI